MKDFHDNNWAWDEVAGQYYLHRFFEIQPDLNYQNPDVLVEMTTMLIRWKIKGVGWHSRGRRALSLERRRNNL